jgi:hypothetical protein
VIVPTFKEMVVLNKWDHLADDFDYWMNRTLDDILTDYVRSKVRGPDHENIQYIHDLMTLEMYCIRGARHMAEAMLFKCKRDKYPEEYHAILSELRPDMAKELGERERISAEELDLAELKQKKDDERRKERRRKESAAWERMAGRSP